MGMGGQTEKYEILLPADRFELNRRDSRLGVAFPDGERMATVQEIFHRLAHFAVAEDEYLV